MLVWGVESVRRGGDRRELELIPGLPEVTTSIDQVLQAILEVRIQPGKCCSGLPEPGERPFAKLYMRDVAEMVEVLSACLGYDGGSQSLEEVESDQRFLVGGLSLHHPRQREIPQP